LTDRLASRISPQQVYSRPQQTIPCGRILLQFLLLQILVLLLPQSAHAEAGQRYKVEIIGADAQTSMLNQFLDIKRRESNADLSADEVQRLAAAAPAQIRELLATEGYFSPSIRYDIERDGEPWTIRYQVTPGTPTHIDAVDIRVKGAIADGPHVDQRRIERLRRRWSLDPGDVFKQADWTRAKNDLLKNLLLNDYPAASITHSEARIDPERNSAALVVEVDSGPFFTFGELQIQGLQRYSRAMIDALNPIHPGDPYSQQKLNDLQSRLGDTGYFRSAFATAAIDPAHSERVPVQVTLTENPRKRLSLGVGFSTDTGARAQVKWLDRNFLQRNWRLESELRIDRETRVLGGDVFLPAITNGWLPSFGAHLEHTIASGEIDDKLRTGARIASPNKLDEKAWAISYLGDRQRIGDSFQTNRQAVIGSFTYTKRRLDNLLAPRRGYVASAELGAGPRGLVNEDNIARVVVRGTLLKPLVRRWHAVLRGEVGQVFGGSRLTVPGDLLFRVGGDQSVRGYGYQSLGPMQNGAVVGGTVSAVVSGELVYQLTPAWGAAVFADAGNAADSWHDFTFKRGSGVGARWRSPIGPVNLDLAYGHAVHKMRLHFSVGYGF
jgi:translocation and assembly module TamA